MILAFWAITVPIITYTLAQNNEFSPNVGTVLFSANDFEKKYWTPTEVGLLRARRYFQAILPPPQFLNSFNEELIHTLFRYFRDTLSNIKREAMDFDTDTIMTTALADTLGGYLKVWVLPVAKLDYYGGSISQDHIFKLLQFYDELKEYLGTDGDGWHSPDDRQLSNIMINIAPESYHYRRMSDPCSQLAYFEQTPDGLKIPLPYINWDAKSSTMFIPLKNISLIPVDMPDKAHTLARFYNTAKNCILLINPVKLPQFENEFQMWLTKDIVPHLRDNTLYLSLGSILTMVNSSNAFDNLLFQTSVTKTAKTHICGLSRTKLTILFIILFIEIAWCMPALYYLLCMKGKTKKEELSDVYMYTEQGRTSKNRIQYQHLDEYSNVGSSSVEIGIATSFIKVNDCETQRSTHLPETACASAVTSKAFYSRHDNTELEVQCPSSQFMICSGTGSKMVYISKNQSTETIQVAAPRKTSLKKVFLNEGAKSKHSSRVVTIPSAVVIHQPKAADYKNSAPKPSKSASGKIKNKKKKEMKPVKQTPLESKPSKLSDHQIYDISPVNIKSNVFVSSRSEASKSTTTKDRVNRKKLVQEIPYFPSCAPCFKEPTQIRRCITGASESGTAYPCACCSTSAATTQKDEKVEYTSEEARTSVQAVANVQTPRKDFKAIKTKTGLKVSGGGNPYFEITIDRPSALIDVDMKSQTNKSTAQTGKRSKIPKPSIAVAQTQNVQRRPRKVPVSQHEKHKSLIPTPKRNTVDDMFIKTCFKNNEKLNETF